MKKLLLAINFATYILLSVVLSQTMVAQNINSPLVEEGKKWHYKVSNYHPLYDELEWDETYSLEGDTVIDGFLCKKLYLSCSGPFDSTDHEYHGAMYERSKKVYYIAPDSTSATLLYDFSCKPGDIVRVRTYVYNTWYNLLVKKKKTVNYLDEDLTVIDWSPIKESEHSDENKTYENCSGTVWIEGIGSPLDLLNNRPTWGNGAGIPSGNLMTCTLNGEVIFDINDFNANSVFIPTEEKDQRYFTQGVTWTEIRLDTLKYDDWYSKAGNNWVPNFETVKYSVVPDTNQTDVWCSNDDYSLRYKVKVDSPSETEIPPFVLYEKHTDEDVSIIVFDHASYAQTYQFNWFVGKELSFQNIEPYQSSAYQYYGTIGEIREDSFGGVSPLKYVDMNGIRIIQGIGVTQWNDGECIFGPISLYKYSIYPQTPPERHYRSMLVHFERNGQVVYDVWPEKGATGIDAIADLPSKTRETFDLQGRRIGKAQEGVNIIRNADGTTKKVLTK